MVFELKGNEELNSKLEKITKEQKELTEEIKLMKERKENIVNELVKSNLTDIHKTEINLNKIREALNNETTLKKLDHHVFKIYQAVFKGIVSKKVNTGLIVTYNDYWGHEVKKDLWLNGSGLAIPKKRWKERAYAITDIGVVLKCIKKYPELVNFIKSNAKRKVFNSFRDSIMDWEILPDRPSPSYSEHHPVYTVHDNVDSHDYGVDKVLLHKYKYIEFLLSKSDFSIVLKEEKDSYHYNTLRYSTNKEIDNRVRFIVGQLPDSAKVNIKLASEIVVSAKENNSELMGKIEKNATPYLVARSL